MLLTAAPSPQLYLPCPKEAGGCGDATAWQVGHLPAGQPFGPWYCDACGFGIRGRMLPDGSYSIESAGRQKRLYVLLRRGNIALVVEHDTAGDGDATDGVEYFYNEGTCPTNYMRQVKACLLLEPHGIDDDPHGVFEFVAVVAAPNGFGGQEFSEREVIALFPDADLTAGH